MLYMVLLLFQSIPESESKSMPRMLTKIQKKTTTTLQDSTNTILRNMFTVNITEDGLLNFMELSKKYVRPAEEYDVFTEDGYILKLFHIPGNNSKVALFCHGLFMTSEVFIIRGNISLISMLAEQDYDIWSMNFRGNRHSRRHIRLNPDKDKEFWQYYMHEVGIYDYKAVIDFILKKTGQKKLSIIGHSEGGAAFFILMSERPDYNNKVNVFVDLSPACYIRNCGLAAKALTNMMPKISSILRVLGIEELAGHQSLLKTMNDIIFSDGKAEQEFYFAVLGAVTGHINPANVETEFIPTMLGHIPAGSGLKNVEHFAHLYLYDNFCKYDDDLNNRNFLISDSPPPEYDLSNATTNVALFAAKNDLLVGVEDVKKLKSKLPNVVHFQIVDDDTFNHMDYMWARTAHTVLYPQIIKIVNKYN